MGDKTYEMLWDCSHCGTQKNLGLTHRHCPTCGAPQDQTRRYFPPEHEKVAVEDHRFVGADRHCPYCSTASSASAQHCPGCGASLEGAQAVQTRQDLVGDQGAPDSVQAARNDWQVQAAVGDPAQTRRDRKPKRKFKWGCAGCITILVLAAVTVGVIFFWKQATGIQVAGHSWERSIVIEEFGPVQESEWCDRMPSGAQNVSRMREVKERRRVQDGQMCTTRRVDNGDGTYSQREDCTPNYRSEPVYADKCTYRINKWHTARTLSETGASLSETPKWPTVQISRPGQCVGCQREGERTETYRVLFVEPGSNERSSCSFDQQKWSRFAVGSKWKGRTTVIGHMLDCTTLRSVK